MWEEEGIHYVYSLKIAESNIKGTTLTVLREYPSGNFCGCRPFFADFGAPAYEPAPTEPQFLDIPFL
jgi:hypothetical protein